MSPIISVIVGQATIFVRPSAPAKERIASGTQDWTLDESGGEPDICTVVCAHCKRQLHFNTQITRESINREMADHRRMYCHGESVR